MAVIYWNEVFVQKLIKFDIRLNDIYFRTYFTSNYTVDWSIWQHRNVNKIAFGVDKIST